MRRFESCRGRVLESPPGFSWKEAAGRISAEMVCPSPPGIPVLAPGELISQGAVDYLEGLVAAGAMVEGAADESLEELRVVAPPD